MPRILSCPIIPEHVLVNDLMPPVPSSGTSATSKLSECDPYRQSHTTATTPSHDDIALTGCAAAALRELLAAVHITRRVLRRLYHCIEADDGYLEGVHPPAARHRAAFRCGDIPIQVQRSIRRRCRVCVHVGIAESRAPRTDGVKGNGDLSVVRIDVPEKFDVPPNNKLPN